MSTNHAPVSGKNYRWTFSNAISTFRIVLALPAAAAYEAGLYMSVVAMAVLAIITDLLDGYVARKNNEISDLGKILDPLADKIFAATAVVVLTLDGRLPVWFVIVVVARDLLILGGGAWVERRTGRVLPSNYPGKAAALLLAVTLILIIAGLDAALTNPLLYGSLALLALSLGLYVWRGVQVLNDPSAGGRFRGEAPVETDARSVDAPAQRAPQSVQPSDRPMA